jgi:hypothetical protein
MALGFVLRRLAERSGLKFRVIRELVPLHDLYFIVREIGFGEVRPLFKHHHAKAISGKFFRKHAPGCARTNDDKIDFVRGPVLGLIHRHL